MNSFQKFFISALIYLLFFYSTAVCRISDKRRCADADCSRPVSLATTLIRYNADDERLMSFPRNVKLKVFSKDAGDTPNFWEVEINGKRGYVPKGLLREDRVLVPPSKLTHIVSTGRDDFSKSNFTKQNQDTSESNLLSATPKLSVANSKGIFSTISGVSADSVPMNSPDIKPQSTRKYEVFEGTTLYDDVVSEKPESPPIIIEDTANKNKESEKKLIDSEGVSHDHNVPSSDIKPVNEILDENVESNNQAILAEPKIEEKDEIIEKGEDDLTKAGEDKSIEPEESPSGSNFIGNIVNTVSNFISSGAGEDLTEEELEEEGDEDEDYENDEDKLIIGEITEKTSVKESGEQEHSEGLDLDTSQTNTSAAPNIINVLDKSSLDFKPANVLKSEEHIKDNQGVEESIDNMADVKDKETVTEEPIKSSSVTQTNVEEKNKLDEENNLPSTFGEEKVLSKPVKVDELESEISQESDLPKEGIVQQSEEKTLTSSSDDLISEYQSDKQGTSQDLKENEVKTEENATEKESGVETTKDQSDEALQSQNIPDPIKSSTQSQIKTDELQDHERYKTDNPQNEEDSILVKEKLTIDEPQNQEQLKTDDPLISGQPETDKLQVQGETKSVESKIQEQSDISTEEPPLEPTARQFLYSSGHKKESSPEDIENETFETSLLHDGIKSEVEHLNDTAEVNIPSATYSSLPTVDHFGSPTYSAVINRRIKSTESSSFHDISSNPEEMQDSGEELDNTQSENTQTEEETPSPISLHQSHSPKYSAVVSNRIGSIAPLLHAESKSPSVAVTEVQSGSQDTAGVTADEKQVPDESVVGTENQVEIEAANEIEPVKEEAAEESIEVTNQYSQLSTPINGEASADMVSETPSSPVDVIDEDPVSPVKVVDEAPASLTDVIDDTPTSPADLNNDTPISPVDVADDVPIEAVSEEGMFSWVTSILDIFGSQSSSSSEESHTVLESLDSSKTAYFADETCSTDGVDGSCPTLTDDMQQEVTWQEASYTSDMWELLDKVPLEATLWLVITAVVVLIFSLGHYYIEAHRRDGPLVAIINKLEREVLILKKERCIMEDRLNIAEQQLEAWNTSSTENDALLVELKQELEETKAAKAELEEQAAQLKEELETVTESGLEMHRLLEESLSSQDGSQVLLSTVETLREKLQRQEEEISGLSDTLSNKNAEVEELQDRLAHSADVARSLEDKVISVTREKEEELLQLRDKHRELISQLEEVMETKALEETRLSMEMSKLRLTIEELQKSLAERDSELDTLKEVVKQLRATDSNEKIEALFDVVSVQAKLKTVVAERDDFREKFMEEEGARKLLEGHMKKITQEVAELKNSFETAEKEKIEALTKLQVLSNYFKEKESQLQKELGLQESMWLQKQSDDHTIYEQMRSLREENEKYKLQNESLKKEIVEQEASFKIQLANTEQKAHENWVASRQAERRVKEAQQEAAQLRNRLTTVEKNSSYSLDEKPNISESNGDPSSPPPSLMFPPTTSPPFMMYGPPIPPPGDFVPPPPFMGSPYPSDSRPPPLGRISSPPLDHRFSPPPPLPYPPYDYPPYGHHSPSPPPPLSQHHRNVHKPQPREMSREQKDHVPNYSPEAEKTLRRNKR